MPQPIAVSRRGRDTIAPVGIPDPHVPVFILTHHAREAAGGMDVRTGGGPDTIRQYLRAGLIDELHIAIAPGTITWKPIGDSERTGSTQWIRIRYCGSEESMMAKRQLEIATGVVHNLLIELREALTSDQDR